MARKQKKDGEREKLKETERQIQKKEKKGETKTGQKERYMKGKSQIKR